MSNILLGVTGSIAAFKAAELTSSLTKNGHSVKVILTKNATKFIVPLTFETLSHNPVYTKMFQKNDETKHIELSKWADILLIAPASFNIIGKMASGIADDLLSTEGAVFLGNGKKIILAPAMNTAMFENPICQENIKVLEKYGVEIVPPKESLLACGDVGKGAMADIEDIIKIAIKE
jgi:phosphopantothenoylcysteine decarboxylase/phosphopantothenoylcysteine decarboxylase/phosphopantothenate--cysteine ligase